MSAFSKRLFVLLALVAVVAGGAVRASHAASASSPSDILTFVASLDSSQPVAGSTSTATGTATLQLDTVNKTMTNDVQWSGLTGPADRSHIHSGAVGVSADDGGDWMFHELIDSGVPGGTNEVLPSLVDCSDGTTIVQPGEGGCAPTTGSLHDVLEIPDGYDLCQTGADGFQCNIDHAVPDGYFVDVHTSTFPGGEIRGQYRLTPSQVVAFAFPRRSRPGSTVLIKFALTDPNGAFISDTLAAGLLTGTCRVTLAASGPTTLAPAPCVSYDPVAHKFFYNLKLGATTGTETFTVTVTYPSTTYTITKTATATIK